MLLSPTLSAREVRVACPLDCPRHPHRRVRQARGGRRHSRRVLPSDRPDTKRGGSRHSRRVLPSDLPDTKSKGRLPRSRWQTTQRLRGTPVSVHSACLRVGFLQSTFLRPGRASLLHFGVRQRSARSERAAQGQGQLQTLFPRRHQLRPVNKALPGNPLRV